MLRNLTSLLGSELHTHDINLYRRAANQWQTFLGGVMLGGIGGFAAGVSERIHDTPMTVTGGIIAGVGAVAAGFGLGGLNETGHMLREERPATIVTL